MTAAATDPALEAALETLFATPFPEFVEERKRLAVGLRAAGHKAAAAALAKVHRPTLASWAINQLVRRAPGEVSAMFATAARVRLGDFAATAEHRGVIARLSALATEILREHDQPTSEATLRRITTSLQALSAYGDFAPDLPGRMTGDRDPPGFDAMALESSAASAAPLSLPASLAAPSAPSAPNAATTATTTTTKPTTTTPAPALTVVPAAPAPKPAAPAPAAPVKETAATIKARIAAKFAEREASASSSTLLAQLAASAALPEDAAKAAAPAAPAAPHLRIVPTPAAPAAPAPSSSALDDADADSDALAAAEAEAAERAVAEAAAALAAAQAAAKAAAARVHLARQKAVLEDLRTRQRRAASSIYDHEQAIALMQRELDQRQALLATARRDSETLQAELEKLTAELAALEPAPPKPDR